MWRTQRCSGVFKWRRNNAALNLHGTEFLGLRSFEFVNAPAVFFLISWLLDQKAPSTFLPLDVTGVIALRRSGCPSSWPYIVTSVSVPSASCVFELSPVVELRVVELSPVVELRVVERSPSVELRIPEPDLVGERETAEPGVAVELRFVESSLVVELHAVK